MYLSLSHHLTCELGPTALPSPLKPPPSPWPLHILHPTRPLWVSAALYPSPARLSPGPHAALPDGAGPQGGDGRGLSPTDHLQVTPTVNARRPGTNDGGEGPCGFPPLLTQPLWQAGLPRLQGTRGPWALPLPLLLVCVYSGFVCLSCCYCVCLSCTAFLHNQEPWSRSPVSDLGEPPGLPVVTSWMVTRV